MAVSPPQVESVTPTNGPVQGGTQIAVSGSGFADGTTVTLGQIEATNVIFVSPTELQATVPPNGPGLYDVVVRDPNGLSATLAAAFEYRGKIPGDVNGDSVVNITDVMLALQVSADQTPDSALNLDSDVNGDGRIGLEEAVRAFELSEVYDTNSFASLAQPVFSVLTPEVTNGTPVLATVQNLAPFEPGVVDWGDGFQDALTESGPVTHLYDNPGSYTVQLQSGAGVGGAADVVVLPTPGVQVTQTTLALLGTDLDDNVITGRVAQITSNNPPHVLVEVVGEGMGDVDATLHVDTPSTNDYDVPLIVSFIDPSPGLHTGQVEVADFPFVDLGEYFISLDLDGAVNATVEAAHPFALTVQLPSFVTTNDCDEILRIWKTLSAQKEAKKQDCDDLAKQLADLQAQRAGLQAQRQAAQNQRDAAQNALDSAQSDFNDLFNYVNSILDGLGQLIQYSSSADFPAGDNHVGARNNGASAGVGISFLDAEGLISRMDLYKEANGHSIGQDLNQLRNLISQMDGLRNQIAQADAQLQQLDNAIANLDSQIAAKQAELDKCRQDCDALEQQVKDYADAHKLCLEQLEKERQAAGAIHDAERAGQGAQEKADATSAAADHADGVIDGRSGSPSQAGNDKDDVQAGRDCEQQAQDLIDQGNQKLQQARDALASGDTDTAKQRAAEAQDLFDQANQMLDDCRKHIQDGQSDAQGRPPRQCTDGDFQQGEEFDTVVWTEILDVALAPTGGKPEKWATTLKDAQDAVAGLQHFLTLVTILGPASPIEGPATPNAGKVAELIVNSYLEIINSQFPFDVYIKVRGHTDWRRVDRRCVNGLWVSEPHEGSYADVVERQILIGTIWGGDRASRQKQLSDILERFLKQHAIQK